MSDPRAAAPTPAEEYVSRYGTQALRLLSDLALVDYLEAERSFAYFIRAAWPVLEPGATFLPNWHQDVIAEYLEATLKGDIKRLIINMPPRYAKSLIVTVMFPAWCWIRNPALRFIAASYSESLALKHNVDRRLLIQSRWYQSAWGSRYALSADQNEKAEYTNDKRGHCVAAGLLGTVTGKGGDYVIVDDPHNPKKAESELERTAALEAFDSTFTSRLDNKKTGRMVVVMQRLHHKDLTGHLMEKGGWTQLKLPAESPTRTVVTYPISKRTKVREAGDILHPAREGKKELEQVAKQMGSYNYAGQYEQNPTPRAGGLFKRHYWRFYKQRPEKLDRILQSWDLAFKKTEQTDFVAGCVVACVGADRYVLDMVNERMGFRESKAAVKTLRSKWPRALTTLIEDKANGPAVEDDLRGELSGVILVSPDGSKWERACLCEPELEGGNVYLPTPESAPWVEPFIKQCAEFPRGDNDDMVDAFTQALNYLRGKAFDRARALGQL